MLPDGPPGLRKRQRVGSSSRLSAYFDPDGTLVDAIPGGFNDPATADVLLCLQIDADLDSAFPDPPASLDLHLHSSVLRRSRYFDALLSDRWKHSDAQHLTHKIPSALRPFDAHIAVFRLLYTLDFSSAITSVTDALDILPVAMELLFDECIRACVRFLEAVPWTEEEEEGVLSVIPFLRQEETQDLLARLSPDMALPEEMLLTLIITALHSNTKVATVKVFVAKLLQDYYSRETVQRVLDRAFLMKLERVKEVIGEYASPDFRVALDDDETEAIQKLNLHAAVANTRHLLWLVERMIELRIADTAVKEWSEQAGLAADLQKTFRDDAWRNVTPGLPSLVMRCTSRLASAVTAGSVLAPRQVRMKLVKDWLPVVNACRDIVSPVSCHKSPYQELEESFLRIISTLAMSDAQELLHQCLPFSTRDVDDCPHLRTAYNTWFRRANRPPMQDGNTG